ncbi:Bone sialoprotein 2 [Lemmus lemmus]
MKTALILLSILGIACAFSVKNFHRRVKAEDSEENGVFKYRPRYFLYKHAYFYPPLKRLPAQGGSDSSEENGDDDSSDAEGEEQENSNEEENNEDSEGNEEEVAETENSTLSSVTPLYGTGTEATPEAETIGLAALQLPKKAGDAVSKAAKKKESDEEEEEEEEEEENENEEAEVEENEQDVNGTSTNSTEVYGGNSTTGGYFGEGEGQSVTEAGVEGATTGREPISDGPTTAVLPKALQRTTPPPEAYGTSSSPLSKTTAEYWGEYEQTGINENDSEYQVYDNENGEPRGDNYRAYEDEYSYYKGRGYEGYEGQDYYYHQ